MAFDRSHWFQSYTGRRIVVDQPDFEVVCIEDIAASLSNVPRWGGHVPFYSIAEHGIRLAKLMPPDLKMVALLKDSPKCFVGELQRPLKRLPQLEGWRDLRDRWALAIGTAMGLGQAIRFPPALVREYDERLVHAERRDLQGRGPGRELCNLTLARCVEPITTMPPNVAKELFLADFEAYKAVTVFDSGVA